MEYEKKIQSSQSSSQKIGYSSDPTENIDILAMQSQIQTTSAMVWCVLCVLLCKFIALIFFVIAYDKYEKASNNLALQQYNMAQLTIIEANKNMKLGVIVAIVCLILEVVAVALLIMALCGVIFSLS
ncbi:MAG: hypothetical protein ACI30H_08535 [Paludibacteraceae bacterium]